MVFNVGANVNFPLTETTDRVFRKVWEMACYAGFVSVREAASVDQEALGSKAAGDGGADMITGTDHGDRSGHLRSTGITATVKREMQTSLPASSSIRIVQTWVVRPSASGRAVA